MSYFTKLASIIQNKLPAKVTGTTVAAGGVAVSGSSGSFSTAGVGVLIPNWNITLTTTGRPIMVMIISDGLTTGAAGTFAASGFGGGSNLAAGDIQIRNNGTTVSRSYILALAPTTPVNPQTYNAPMSFLDIKPAGTYNYIGYASTIGSSTNLNVNNLKLVAYEI